MTRVSVLAAFFLAGASPALAEEPPTFSVSLGAFFTDRDSDTRIDADNGDTGSDVDLEDDLGFDKSDTVFRLDGYWRFAAHHRIDVSAFDLSRTATKVIDRDITIGDTTFEIDTEVEGDLDLNIYKAAYTWQFLTDESDFLGLTAGLYIADIGTSFSGSGPLGLSVESDGVTAPLPVVGLRGEYHLSERWLLRGSAEIFLFEYNEFDGSLYDVFAGIDYGFNDTAAVGLGINTVRLNVGFDGNRFQGDVDWAYSGAMLYLKLDF
jgi:hypothetical protein